MEASVSRQSQILIWKDFWGNFTLWLDKIRLIGCDVQDNDKTLGFSFNISAFSINYHCHFRCYDGVETKI